MGVVIVTVSLSFLYVGTVLESPAGAPSAIATSYVSIPHLVVQKDSCSSFHPTHILSTHVMAASTTFPLTLLSQFEEGTREITTGHHFADSHTHTQAHLTSLSSHTQTFFLSDRGSKTHAAPLCAVALSFFVPVASVFTPIFTSHVCETALLRRGAMVSCKRSTFTCEECLFLVASSLIFSLGTGEEAQGS